MTIFESYQLFISFLFFHTFNWNYSVTSYLGSTPSVRMTSKTWGCLAWAAWSNSLSWCHTNQSSIFLIEKEIVKKSKETESSCFGSGSRTLALSIFNVVPKYSFLLPYRAHMVHTHTFSFFITHCVVTMTSFISKSPAISKKRILFQLFLFHSSLISFYHQ